MPGLINTHWHLLAGSAAASDEAVDQYIEDVVAVVYLGPGDELGTLESGKIADIIVIDGDPLVDVSHLTRVAVVIQGGRIVFDNRQ